MGPRVGRRFRGASWLVALLRRSCAPADYVDMMMGEGQERVRAGCGGNYDRLARIKADRDPDNAFRLNQTIQPAPRPSHGSRP